MSKIEQLQQMEQAFQGLNMQKQQHHAKLLEIDSALSELETTTESYKIIGNLMVKTDKEKVTKELTDSKERAEIRIKSLESQEKPMLEKLKTMREEVMAEMENGQSSKSD